MNVEHWWNDADWGMESYSKKTGHRVSDFLA